MSKREKPGDTNDADVGRSSEDIRRAIIKGEENISQTVGQISEIIEEKLDWREYVKKSPYLAIGTAAGLGYLASKMFITRTTPLERIMGSIAEEVRGSLGAVLSGTTRPGLVRATVQHIATKAAAGWVKNIISTAANSGDGTQPQQDVIQPSA